MLLRSSQADVPRCQFDAAAAVPAATIPDRYPPRGPHWRMSRKCTRRSHPARPAPTFSLGARLPTRAAAHCLSALPC